MNKEIAVVLMLKSSAWIAVGDAIACQASRSTVQITRLRIGTQMNPTIRARATTAIADDKRSPVLVSRERNSGILLREELLRLPSLSESLIDTISHTTDTNNQGLRATCTKG